MQAKKLKTGTYLLLCAACIVTSVLSSFGMELLFLSSVSTAMFAYLLSIEKVYKVAYIPVLSALLTFLLSQSKVRALISVLYIIPAIAFVLLIVKRAGSSTALIVVSILYVVLASLALSGIVYVAYGDVREGLSSVLSQARQLVNDSLEQSGLPYIYTELVREAVHTLKLSLVGIGVLSCEVLALLTEMLFKLLDRSNKTKIYEASPWLVELSVPGSIILIITTFASVLFAGEYIAYYVFLNLTYILIMFGVLVGIRATFGKESAFRKKGQKRVKIFTLVFCGVLLYMSPFFLLVFFALRGALYSILTALKNRRNRNNGNGDDNNGDDDDIG